VIEGVEIHKYRPYPGGVGKVGYLFEYVYSFCATAWLVAKVWRKRRFHAIQACNPPDIFWPLGLLYRMLGGSKFVFDHHDLCPELYESRFPGGPRLPYLGLRWLERMTFSSADHVISTNESYRRKALERSSKRPEEVTVVRTGPDADRLRAGDPDESLRRGRRYLVGYIGVMGPQDGVDIVLRAADKIVRDFGRKDIAFTLIGSGDCYEELLRLCDRLELGDFVEFTGRAPDDLVARILSTADIGLSPDPKNPLNDVSTMNKTMEYMAYGLPVVAFDLVETKVSARDAAEYAIPNEVEDYAAKIVDLLDDEERRKEMSVVGRARIDEELAWSHQRTTYVGVYDGLLRDGANATKHESNVLRLVRSA
jgi:glycosyltransferase involved in cell wall biosynthesis